MQIACEIRHLYPSTPLAAIETPRIYSDLSASSLNHPLQHVQKLMHLGALLVGLIVEARQCCVRWNHGLRRHGKRPSDAVDEHAVHALLCANEACGYVHDLFSMLCADEHLRTFLFKAGQRLKGELLQGFGDIGDGLQ